MIRCLADIYRRLPVKPFLRTLGKLYLKYRLVSRNRVVIAERDEIRYELDLRESIDSSIYYEGCFEPDVVRIIQQYVQQGMVAIDIGANIGCHTFRLAQLVGDKGKVIAFEPSSWAFRKLERNSALNNFGNIVLEKTALSDEKIDGKLLRIYASWPLRCNAHDDLHPIHRGYPMNDVVDLITLDDYVRMKKITKVDFIKLDVDGYELKVIRGGIKSIRAFRPIMIVEFGEYTLEGFGDSLEDLVDLLAESGYLFYSGQDLGQYDNKESLLKAVPPDATINVLCKPHSTPILEAF